MGNSVTGTSPSDPNHDRSIEYTIQCSDARGQEARFVFHQHTAPSSICQQTNPLSSQTKTQAETLMYDLVKAHHDEVQQARTWFCVQCDQPATNIIHNSMSYLHLPNPQVIEMAFPCCGKRQCDADIRANFAGLMAIFDVLNGTL